LDWDMLRQVVAILKSSGVSEIAVDYGDTKIRVKRAVPPYAAWEAGEESLEETTKEPTCAPTTPSTMTVKAGRVGVLYRREQGTDRPLVEEGQEVEEGQTIAYIESVKLMTEVPAPQKARVAKILLEDGAAVEYGQPIFELEPPSDESSQEGEE